MADTGSTTEQGSHPRVLIANINRGTISSATAMGFISALTSGAAVTILCAESGPYLDSGRNRAIANALVAQQPWEWLLWIDSDIEFTPDNIRALLSPYTESLTSGINLSPSGYPLIGGVYVNPFDDGGVAGEENGDHIGPVVYEWVTRDDLHGEKAGVPTDTFRRLSRKSLEALPGLRFPDDPIIEVDCVGTGFLAMHRSLLTRMEDIYAQPLPWFDEPVRDGIHYGEDMGFCLRVMDMGYPVLVNRAVTVLHHKTIKLT